MTIYLFLLLLVVCYLLIGFWVSVMARLVMNLLANAGDTETLVQSPGQEDPLEKEMATHSSIRSWTIL